MTRLQPGLGLARLGSAWLLGCWAGSRLWTWVDGSVVRLCRLGFGVGAEMKVRTAGQNNRTAGAFGDVRGVNHTIIEAEMNQDALD